MESYNDRIGGCVGGAEEDVRYLWNDYLQRPVYSATMEEPTMPDLTKVADNLVKIVEELRKTDVKAGPDPRPPVDVGAVIRLTATSYGHGPQVGDIGRVIGIGPRNPECRWSRYTGEIWFVENNQSYEILIPA